MTNLVFKQQRIILKNKASDQVHTCDARTVGVMASGGSGRKISTLDAEERSLNWLRAFTRYSVRLRLCFSTVHSTHTNGRTFWLSRYVLWRHEGNN